MEIYDNVDMVMGIKTVYEMEGVISNRDSYLHILNRSIPFFTMTEIILKPGEQTFIKNDVPFIDEISD